MRKSIVAASTTIAAALATLTLATGAAQAAPARVTTPVLLGSLQLAKTDDTTGVTTTASLNCVRGINVYGQVYVSGNGTVTNADAACQELNAVGGDFTKLAVHPTWMPLAGDAPVSVTATGNWGNTAVNYSQTFQNASYLAKTTGDVFQF
ncbi:SSI family serine proteinase inhibitor [Kitasatospora sp. NPDC006697]|uniref:SSI family serine proteinase inhibitor n=1 Tax=Kitasatospora sp. NPDC006697 TaxID=3364020 RepID=UPI0036C06156